ncbi:MAG: HAD-IB family phosphatase [Candidatus Pacebacteria bacterium]|jgi:HAD superfamily phosphoserine phosphatase-like hydrolase|nr:HAD-IB family phosphatase [Candidatus Paceibacterota bacterium]
MEESSALLREFKSKDKKGAVAKLERLVLAGRDKLHLVLDFDRTLTIRHKDDNAEVTTWRLLNTSLPLPRRETAARLYAKHRPPEARGKMDEAEAIVWWSSVLNLYPGSGLRLPDLAIKAKSEIPAREGANELFDACIAKGIPTVIISAGIKDIIDIWCENLGVRPTRVISTKLRCDDEGYICGWDRDSLVHILNKTEKGKETLAGIKKNRPNIFLVGDSLDDADMAQGSENVLRFIIDNPRSDDIRTQEFYDKIFDKFDFVLPGDSLLPLVEIIKSIN